MNLFAASTGSIARQSFLYGLLWLISSSLLTTSSAKISPSLIKDFSKKEFNSSSDPEIPKVTPPPNSPSPIAASPSLKTHSPSSVTSVSSQEMIENIDQRCVKRPDLIKKIPSRYIPPLFRSCIPYIYQHSKVPIVLPAISHPRQWNRHNLENEINYPFISEVSSSQYWLSWKAKSKDIPSSNPIGGALFNRGYIIGEELNSQSLTLASLHAEFRGYVLSGPTGLTRLVSEASELGGSVALSKGIIGYYFPPMCGANCHGAFSKIIWDQGDYRYTVALIMGQRKDIIEMANSAIDNQRN